MLNSSCDANSSVFPWQQLLTSSKVNQSPLSEGYYASPKTATVSSLLPQLCSQKTEQINKKITMQKKLQIKYRKAILCLSYFPFKLYLYRTRKRNNLTPLMLGLKENWAYIGTISFKVQMGSAELGAQNN